MYSTCLFCNRDLGSNEVIEHFPVGRRLAFDATKGRLWVVCRQCERWNLTPLEERWEAIEEAERVFTGTRLRATTDNIGLARLPEGLELIRIGAALRPEMASWRYGDQFGRRRRKQMLLAAAGTSIITAGVILGPVTGLVAGGGWMTWQALWQAYSAYDARRVRARVRLPEGEQVVALRKGELNFAALVRDEEYGWALRMGLVEKRSRPAADRNRDFLYRGPQALVTAARVLPAINEKGGKPADVQSAVQLISAARGPGDLFQRYATVDEREFRRDPRNRTILHLPTDVRLALEMASHEEQERRAMEGELALLEAAWRDAETIAKIADDLLLPGDTEARLEKLRPED
ncbi:MAG: hypothetical protein WD801_10095 [Gemmatimonadaceae bacterium]